jgi:hypothetical protein
MTSLVEKHTERTVLALLNQRYTERSQGGDRWVRAEHVRSHLSLVSRRTADFIAQDLWVSKGFELHGHEVKVSRSDWLRELKDATKADEFRRYCHRWWLVIPDASLVRPGELPEGWGQLSVRNGSLRVVVPAPQLDPDPMPREFVASLLRATAKTAAQWGADDPYTGGAL